MLKTVKHTPEQLSEWLLAYQQRGDQKALEKLCKALEDIMRAYFQLKFRDKNPALIDDLCQETYFRLLRSLPTISEPMKLKHFVLKIAFIVMQTHFRSSYRRQDVVQSDLAVGETPDLTVDHSHAHAPMDSLPQHLDIKKALNELPEKTREILLLKADGYKYEEIAEKMDMSESAVKMQIKRGMENLKNLLINVTFWGFIATLIVESITKF